MTETTSSESAAIPPGPERPAATVAVRSEELLHGRREIEIIHAGEIYRLRVTRNGKLLLTK
jgi:hemin uptake protein HemP